MNNSCNFQVLAACAIFVCLNIGGCSSQEAPTTQPTEGDGKAPSSETFQPVATPLPRSVVDASCDPEAVPSPLSWCEWAATNDAVILAEVLAVSPTTAPVTYNNILQEDPSCFTTVRPALRLTVQVWQVLSGEVDRDIVEVDVGAEHVRLWDPTPSLSEAGEFFWAGLAAGQPEPLGVGGSLVLGISQESTERRWSLMGEMPMAFTEAGGLTDGAKPNTATCHPYPRPDVTGMTLQQLAAALSACPSPTGLVTAALHSKEAHDGYPGKTYAATCPQKEPDPIDVGKCVVTSDCDVFHSCVGGECLPDSE